jgi:DNA-binding transcriptional MerR regulator
MEKSPEAFRTIREVADAMELPQHVLRFWETRFPQIRPLKRAGGRRYYRPDDVERLRLIRRLLYEEGYTIKGVQKLFREQGVQAVANGVFELRPPFEPKDAGERPATIETVGRLPEPQIELDDRFDQQPLGRTASTSWLAEEDLARLRDCMAEIRRAEQILAQARAPEP